MKLRRTHKRLVSEKELIDIANNVTYKYHYIIPKREMEDVQMMLVSNYLSQEDKISERFEGNAKASTYVTAILVRMCCSIIRKEKRHWQNNTPSEETIDEGGSALSAASKTLINDEVNYLKRIFTLLNDKYKTLAFTAYLDGLEAKEPYIQSYDAKYKKNKTLINLSPQENLAKGKLYEQLAMISNKVENNKISGDAVRMWLNKQEASIISRLNGPFKRTNYNKESYQILFELFYDRNFFFKNEK